METNRKHRDYIPKLIICSLIFFILGLACFYVGGSDFLKQLIKDEQLIVTWKNIFCSIGSVLIISGIYNVIYEYSIRKSMLNIIREELEIKEYITKTGVTHIKLQLSDIPYKELFQDVRSEIDIVHSYGNSWSEANVDYIRDTLKNKRNITIRVILLSPQSRLIEGLYELYRKDSIDDLHRSMKNSIDTWFELVGLANSTQNNIKIYYHDQNPTHSIYRFDDIIVNVSNLIHDEKTTKLPTIICKRNDEYKETLYSRYYEEIENIILYHTKEVTVENKDSFFPNNIQETVSTKQ